MTGAGPMPLPGRGRQGGGNRGAGRTYRAVCAVSRSGAESARPFARGRHLRGYGDRAGGGRTLRCGRRAGHLLPHHGSFSPVCGWCRAFRPRLVIVDGDFALAKNAMIQLMRENTDNPLNAIEQVERAGTRADRHPEREGHGGDGRCAGLFLRLARLATCAPVAALAAGRLLPHQGQVPGKLHSAAALAPIRTSWRGTFPASESNSCRPECRARQAARETAAPWYRPRPRSIRPTRG